MILFHVARCCYSFQSLCYLVSNDYVTNGCLQACPGQNENLSLTFNGTVAWKHLIQHSCLQLADSLDCVGLSDAAFQDCRVCTVTVNIFMSACFSPPAFCQHVYCP